MKSNVANKELMEEYRLDVLPGLLDDAKEHLVSEFEDSLPEYLGNLEVELMDKYLEETLPGYLEKLELELKEQFMGKTLPEELEKAEANLIDEHTEWLLEQEKEARVC